MNFRNAFVFPAKFCCRAAWLFGAITTLGTHSLYGTQTVGANGAAATSVPDRSDSSEYFGAPLPHGNAEIFAPGIVSLPHRFEARITFSADLQECYLTETDATFSHPKLLVSHHTSEGWTSFSDVPFAAKFNVCHEPFLSGDNQRLYFTADGDPAVPGNVRDFWVVERLGKDWGEPRRLPPPVNSPSAEFYFGNSSDGTVVFASNRVGGQGDFDLYYIPKASDEVNRAENFGAPVNTPGPEYDPCLFHDGKTLIFASAREGATSLDLYVSFRDNENHWSKPVALKGKVNTSANEYGPSLSPDGAYLFFVRHDGKQSDIYWLSTAGITADAYAAERK